MPENTAAAAAVGHAGPRLALHVLRGRWFSLLASMSIMSAAGAAFLFGSYSREIKSSLAYDQRTLNLIGFFKDLGASIGIISGLVAELTPTYFLLLIGSSMNFAGYFTTWLVVTKKIAKPKVWQMCIYTFIGANSVNFANTAVLSTCVKNFPENRGVLFGLLKGLTGLSGAIITQIYLALYGDNDPKFLVLLIAWLPSAIYLVFGYAIRPVKVVRQENAGKVLYHFLYVSIVLALFLMAMTITQKLLAFPRAAYAATAILVCGLLIFPLSIVFREELLIWKEKKMSNSPPITIKVENSTSCSPQPDEKPKNISLFADICSKPERGEDYAILQAFFSIDMLMVIISTGCGFGASLTAIDNLGQIGQSLEYPVKTVTSFVSLVSIWNYFGQIFAGLVSEKLLTKFRFPRPLMNTVVLLLACVGHLLIAFPLPYSVYAASIIIGFSFGAQFPLLLSVVSELFGLKHYAMLFNVGLLACPIGSYVLNVKITGLLYDHEALKELSRKNLYRKSGEELTCIGSHCYRLSFVILAVVTCFGAIASLILAVRTKHFYKSDIYKRFREKSEEAIISQVVE